MGYAKFLEDIKRRFEESIIDQEVMMSNPEKYIFQCYYCNEKLSSNEERNRHIKKLHNYVGPVLFINDKIIQKECIVDNINSAKILMYDFRNIEVSVNGKIINKKNTIIDITNIINKNSENKIKIGSKDINIKKYESNYRSLEDVENKYILPWEKQIRENKALLPTPTEFHRTLNDHEIKYINGFYDYFTACKTDVSSLYKNDRYSSAFSLLISFNNPTPKALLILKVIAFKFNWIGHLAELSKSSMGDFNKVVEFMLGRNSTNEFDHHLSQYGLFVESYIENCFTAILAFQNKIYENVDLFLSNWNDNEISKIVDINEKDRILLLKVRRLKTLNKNKESEKYIDFIRSPVMKKN